MLNGMIQMKKERVLFVIDMILIICGIAILSHRALLGVDFTDQSWYVAEPYLVSQGAIPYVNNWTQAPGFTIPLALLTRLYVFLSGGTEGIFLFSRIIYIIWVVFIGVVVLFLINGKNKKRLPVILLLPFLFIPSSQLFSISYNSIGMAYLLLACAVLFSGFYGFNVKEGFRRGFAGGVIIARAVIGTPYILFPCVMIGIILCLAKRWKQIQGFVLGGGVTAVFVVGWCCVKGTVRGFVDGLGYWLSDSAYFKIERRFLLKDALIEVCHYVGIFVACMIIAFIVRRIFYDRKALFEKFLYMLLIGCLILGVVGYIYTKDFKTITYWGWFQSVVLYFFISDADQKKRMGLFSVVVLLYNLVFFFSSIFNIYGFEGREYWLYIPVIISIVSVFDREGKTGWDEIYVRLGAVLLTLSLIYMSYTHIYRDDAVNNLTTKVESGVWKGLYTTEERAKGVVELEELIRGMTDNNDKVLFMDWASFGYLMSNGEACSPSSYDNMQYSYGVNNPEIMFDYFGENGKVPDKIIYVDFGRDEMLSIEYSNWKFNHFVNVNYQLKDVSETELFRVLCYNLTDKENAMAMVQREHR